MDQGAVGEGRKLGLISVQNLKDETLVSVVINTYNRSAVVVRRALRSIQDQTYANWECLVVDDGSTDDTEKVLSAVAAKDSRIKYLRKENGGASAAKNYGIRRAKGSLIALTDDDDEYLPGYLTRAVAEFERLPQDVGFLSGSVFNVDEAGIITFLIPPLEPIWKHPVGNGWVFRRECFFEHNIFFDENLRGFEDLDITLRLQKFYNRFVFHDPVRRYYLSLGHSKQSKKSSSVNTNFQVTYGERYLAKYEEDYKKFGAEALAWLYLFMGLVNARYGNMQRGRMFLRKSLHSAFAYNTFVYYFFAMLGSSGFRLCDEVKNRFMRIVRSHLLNKVPSSVRQLINT